MMCFETRVAQAWPEGKSSTTPTAAYGFVGSLGHTSEDNTGLIYMRARYMDPALGRFVSEDPGRDGGNWFRYCGNDPVNGVDGTGMKKRDLRNNGWFDAGGWAFTMGGVLSAGAIAMAMTGDYGGAMALANIACFAYAISLGAFGEIASPLGLLCRWGSLTAAGFGGGLYVSIGYFIKGSSEAAQKALVLPGATVAVTAMTAYGMMCFGAILAID